MFVDLLTTEQKKALVSLFTFIARADGKLEGSEWHYLNRFCEIHGLTYDINQESDLRLTCSVFLRQKAKMTAMVEVVKMAISDLDYDTLERQAVHEIGRAMELDHDTIESLHQWAMQGCAWGKAGAALINQI